MEQKDEDGNPTPYGSRNLGKIKEYLDKTYDQKYIKSLENYWE